MRTSSIVGGFRLLAAFCGAILLLVGGAPRSGAQQARRADSTAWLTTPIVASSGAACTAIPVSPRFVEPPRSTECRVLKQASLGHAADTAWSYAVYRHEMRYTFPDRAMPDTMVELELVLFAARLAKPGDRTVVAHFRESFEVIADMSFTLATHGAGALLQVEFCLNGTGGCWQEYSLHHGSRWKAISSPDSLIRAPLQARGLIGSIAGERLSTSTMNASTLAGSSALYEPKDANCCPSREVRFQLVLNATGFQLASLRVVDFRDRQAPRQQRTRGSGASSDERRNDRCEVDCQRSVIIVDVRLTRLQATRNSCPSTRSS